MGIFDVFKSKARDEKRIAKSLATIKNAKAIREDRVGAIEYFKSMDDAATAVPALLQRFEYSLEHGINDTREKESSMEGILAFGAPAMPLVREHLLVTNRIAWPIKVLTKLGEESQVVEILKAALDFGDISFDQAKVDKNYDILCYLRDYKLPGFAEKALHFLNDPDERVRFAATELLIEQDDPAVAKGLERFIGDTSPDNTRMRQATVLAFLKNGWKLQDPGRYPNGQIEGPLFVNAEGRLEVRR